MLSSVISLFPWFAGAIFLLVLALLARSWGELKKSSEALGTFFGALMGLLGLAVSAYLGFLGLQVSDREQRQCESAAVAAAIIGELSAITEQIGEVENIPLMDEAPSNGDEWIQLKKNTNFATFLVAQIETIVFESYVEKIGLLPANVTTTVVETYAMIRFIRRKKRDLEPFDLEAKKPEDDEVKDRIDQIKNVSKSILTGAEKAKKQLMKGVVCNGSM